jgi:hypothetical protein
MDALDLQNHIQGGSKRIQAVRMASKTTVGGEEHREMQDMARAAQIELEEDRSEVDYWLG